MASLGCPSAMPTARATTPMLIIMSPGRLELPWNWMEWRLRHGNQTRRGGAHEATNKLWVWLLAGSLASRRSCIPLSPSCATVRAPQVFPQTWNVRGATKVYSIYMCTIVSSTLRSALANSEGTACLVALSAQSGVCPVCNEPTLPCADAHCAWLRLLVTTLSNHKSTALLRQ